MSDYILIIDDSGRLKPLAEAALIGSNIQFVIAEETVSAKRKLVQAIPSLIVCSLRLKSDEESGFLFCKALRGHSGFSKIPVLLCAEELNSGLQQKSAEAGANGILKWPASAADLRTKLGELLPDLKPTTQPTQQAAESTPDVGSKLKLAQHLLAKVLHNFKTSDLLQVVELEDVPRVVLEIARSVCSHAATEHGRNIDDSTEVNLEKAFIIKDKAE